MSFRKEDSSVSHIFALQIDGVLVDYVHSVSGLEQKQSVIDYWQNDKQGGGRIGKMPGPVESSDVKVTRATTGNDAFSKWLKDSFEGKMGSARKNITFIQMNHEKQPMRRFNLRNAWCFHREFGDLESGSTTPIEETAHITYEEMKVEES
ncbi:phage tail protein [Actinomadura meridiana]|uniref:Phage tail protein n=1 Tax=Actinomadura meridiana TaxID=559626 RepID=A0ABP8BRS3_9ACTN